MYGKIIAAHVWIPEDVLSIRLATSAIPAKKIGPQLFSQSFRIHTALLSFFNRYD